MRHSCFPRQILWLALVIALSALGTAPARAQQKPESGAVVRAGVAVPLGDTEDSVEAIVGLELEANPDHALFFREAQNSISVDWVSISTSTNSGSKSVDYVPVLLNWKWWQRPGTRSAFYLGAGVGFAFAGNDIEEMDVDHEFNPAWQVFVGKPIGQNLRLDVRLIAGKDPGKDGIFVTQLGWKF